MLTTRFISTTLSVIIISMVTQNHLAHGQEETLGFNAAQTLRKPIKFTAQGSNLDDAIVELSKAAEVNIIADADTLLTEGSAPVKQLGDQQDAFLNVLLKVAHQGKLAWLRTQPFTFLVWGERDNVALMKEILGQKRGSIIPKTISPDQLKTELLEYLRTRPDWVELGANGEKMALPISDLPQPLRSHLISATQASYLHSDRVALNTSWLSDDLWSKATLGVSSIGKGRRAQQVLDIRSQWQGLGDNQTGNLSVNMSFAIFDATPGN